MKVLCLVTFTDCENKHRSLSCAGFDVVIEQYDNRPHDRQFEIVEYAKDVKPDFIVFIGAIEQYHNRPVLTPDILRRLRDVAPHIHMCNDAADDPWWDWLEKYDREECFTVQVSIDGSTHNPIASFANGLLALTPTDVRPFAPKPWRERGIKCGFVGGLGHTTRKATIEGLLSSNHLQFFEGPTGRSYDQFAQQMCDIQVVPNIPLSGSGRHLHVKGRVVEAGFAGCCVLEHTAAPTGHWFEAGSEFIQYRNIEDIRAIVSNEAMYPILGEVARKFHEKVVKEHHPVVFWKRVLDKAGVQWEPEPTVEFSWAG